MQKLTAQTKQIASNSTSAMNVATGKMKELKIATGQATAQQELLLNKINDLKATLQLADADPKLFRPSEVMEMRAEVEKLTGQYNRLGTTAKKTNNDISTSIKKGVTSLRRFGLALFSIRGVYSAISRIVSEYKQTDDDLRAGMEVSMNVMGQMLAPAIRLVTNLIQYLVIGVATLVKMFTGFDALAKTTTKNINNAGKATKSLNRELSTMDEITNLGDDKSGMGAGFIADLKALEEFAKKVEQVQSLFEKWEVEKFVNKLKDLGNWIVKNKDWLILLGIQLAAIFGTAKISVWLASISKLIGVAGTGAAAAGGVGLAGLLGVLLAIAGLSAIAVTITYTILQIRESVERGKVVQDLGQNYEKRLTGGTDKILAENNKALNKQTIDRLNNNLKSSVATLKKYEAEYSKIPLWLRAVAGGERRANIKTWQSVVDRERAEIRRLGGTPKFATGGVVNQPTFGLMGEYPNASSNPEIISPQSIMRDTMKQAFAEILPQMAQQGNNQGDIILNVNGRDLAKATYEDYQKEGSRLGQQTIVRRVG